MYYLHSTLPFSNLSSVLNHISSRHAELLNKTHVNWLTFFNFRLQPFVFDEYFSFEVIRRRQRPSWFKLETYRKSSVRDLSMRNSRPRAPDAWSDSSQQPLDVSVHSSPSTQCSNQLTKSNSDLDNAVNLEHPQSSVVYRRIQLP